MAIRFVCTHCGHHLRVDDGLEGKRARCTHCGLSMVIPHHASEPHLEATTQPSAPQAAGLRLREIEPEQPPDVIAELLAPPKPVAVKPASAEPRPSWGMTSDPDEPLEQRTRWDRFLHRLDPENYEVLDPYRFTRTHSSAGPPPIWVNLPTLTARFVARHLRTLRNWLYLVSLAGLVAVLYGYLFSFKGALHIGAVIVVAANALMLFVGLAYLISLPFKDSLFQGLANLFIPFYAVYYWWRHWKRMRNPVRKTLGAFIPVVLVALAYAAYKEAPAVEQEVKKDFPQIEKEIEEVDHELGLDSKDQGPDDKARSATKDSPINNLLQQEQQYSQGIQDLSNDN